VWLADLSKQVARRDQGRRVAAKRHSAFNLLKEDIADI
jgi:hypothetical protein